MLTVWVALASCDASARHDTEARAAAPTEAQKDGVDDLLGNYVHVGGKAEQDAVLEAIDDVVADMNVFARGIARDRLRESNPVPKKLEISRNGDEITIAFDGRKYAAPLDGSSVKVVGVTGDTLDYRVSLGEDKLRQHFAGGKGKRVNTLRRRGDKRLKVAVKVSSDSLPKPLQYTLTLERRGE